MNYKNSNKKGNERPRDEKGRFVSIAAIYSTKHNTVDFEEYHKNNMKFWESKGLVKSNQVIRPFAYKAEAFDIPSDYYYRSNEVKAKLEGYCSYVLQMSNLTEANLEEPENVLTVAKLVPMKDDKTFYFKNELYHNEGLTLVELGSLSKSFDFYLPITTAPKDTERLFQGVIAKRKLKDLVIDTYYKLDFNKATRTHYTFRNKVDEDDSVYVCKYFSTPIEITIDTKSYNNVSAIIFRKTTSDEDGDRVISTNPGPKWILTKEEGGFLVLDFDDVDTPKSITSLDDLNNLVSNLMIPEEILREFSRIELSKNQHIDSANHQPTPRREFDMPVGVTVDTRTKYPITITLLDEDGNPKEHITAYKIGVFRSPRKEGNYEEIVNVRIKDKDYCYATASKDLWILIDKNVNKIYFYSVYYNRVIDWCFAATFDFLNLLNRFSSEFLTNDVKEELLKNMNDIRLNYYSQYEDITTENEGLSGFLESL